MQQVRRGNWKEYRTTSSLKLLRRGNDSSVQLTTLWLRFFSQLPERRFSRNLHREGWSQAGTSRAPATRAQAHRGLEPRRGIADVAAHRGDLDVRGGAPHRRK